MQELPVPHGMRQGLKTRNKNDKDTMDNKGKLNIVKASAGSGKTWRLAQEYIDAVTAGGPGSFRHVTAVTFTNKAAAEMKERIVAEMARRGESSPEARRRLREILHGYGAFAVGTIDSYLQRLSRSLAFETGGAGGRVDLDEEAILEDVTARVLAQAADDPETLALLTEISLSQVEDGRSWDVSHVVTEAARRFLDEPFLQAARRGQTAAGDKEALDAAAAAAKQTAGAFEDDVRALGERGLSLLAEEGLTPEQMPGKSRSAMTVLRAWAAGTVKAPPAKLRECAEKSGSAAAAAVADASDALFGQRWRDYRTAVIVTAQLPMLRLRAATERATAQALAENGITMLRRSGDALAAVLSDPAGARYAAAKDGRRTDLFLVDEAQDTSSLQWESLGAMMRESAERGGSALAVGDVKQSIYRWRNSDWRILDATMERDLPGVETTHETLAENWRSARAIVEFNNELFAEAARRLPALTGCDGTAERIYGDCMQAVPEVRQRAAGDGEVRLVRLSCGDWRDEALRRLPEEVRRLLAKGLAKGRVTVLVRTAREGAAAAAALLAEGIPVVTDDSLAAGGVLATKRIAAALALEADPTDDIARLTARRLGAEIDLSGAATLYEKVLLAARTAGIAAGETPYVQTMADAAMEWQRSGGSDAAAFVTWWRRGGAQRSVAAADGDAVRIMTIHKSKGLSLDAVIVPFFRCDLVAGGLLAPTIWCRDEGSFAGLGALPLKAAETTLADTAFEGALREERMLQGIDGMNLAYVAFTRARKSLTVMYPTGPLKGTAHAMTEMLDAVFGDRFGEDGMYTSGTLAPQEGAPARPAPPRRAPELHDIMERATLRGGAEAYFAAKTEKEA